MQGTGTSSPAAMGAPFQRRRGSALLCAPMTIPDSMVSALKGAAGVAVAVAFWEGIRALGVVDARDLPSFAAIIRTALTGLLGGELLAAVFATV